MGLEAAMEILFIEQEEETTQRRAGKRKKSKRHESPEYLKPKELFQMAQRGNLSSGCYQTLSDVLSDRKVGVNLDGDSLSCINHEYEATFLSIDCTGSSSRLYPDNCIGSRTAEQYHAMLSRHGFSCSLQRESSEGATTFALTNPKDMVADIYLTEFEVPQATGEWIERFKSAGYKIQLWAGGDRPLATIDNKARCADIQYSRNTHAHIAAQGIALLKGMGYGVELHGRQ